MDFGITVVAIITVISYLIGQAFKCIPAIDNKWIPIICGGAGLIIGVVAFYIGMPDFPASDPITAAAVGVASGFAATGINQIYKQLSTKE